MSPAARSLPGSEVEEHPDVDDVESVDGVEAPVPDYARPILFHILYDDPANNAFAIEFVRDNQIGDVSRRHTVRMWKLFLKYHCRGTPISYDTVERRVFENLPKIRVSWKVQNLQTNKFFTGTGISFPEKSFGDRDVYETLMVWARADLRDLIRLHAGMHMNLCDFVHEGIIHYEEVGLTLTFDGIPLSNTSPDTLNVMALMVRGCRRVYIAAARVAKRREAKNPNDFLDTFVEQANELGVTVDYFVADAPMRAFLKCIKGHAGRHSCETCEARGVCIARRITYPACMVEQRTRTMQRWIECVADLEEQKAAGNTRITDVKGVTGRSPLLSLKDFDIVRKAPTDPMHRDWLGLAKSTLWRPTVGIGKSGAISSRGQRITQRVSQHYRFVRLPSEFTHKSRPIEYPHFKAQEWKSMVVTSFMVICQVVTEEVGHKLAHIWCLFTFLIFLYNSPEWIFNQFQTKDLEDLQQQFYDEFEEELGQAACSYNLHAFYHMPLSRKCARSHNVSTEPFESAYGEVQTSYKAGTRNVALQIVRNMMLKAMNHTPEYCKHRLILLPENQTRSDDSIVLDERLTYYKIKAVNENTVTVQEMLTLPWSCPTDPTLPFALVGVQKFDKYNDVTKQLPISLLKGKGVHLRNGLLVPFYWDLLYS